VGNLLAQVLDRPHMVGKQLDEAQGIVVLGKVGIFQYGKVYYIHIHMADIWDNQIS
jgi:hypothetical protein